METVAPELEIFVFTTDIAVYLMTLWAMQFSKNALKIAKDQEENGNSDKTTQGAVVDKDDDHHTAPEKASASHKDWLAENQTSPTCTSHKSSSFFSRDFLLASAVTLRQIPLEPPHLQKYVYELRREAKLHENCTTNQDNYLTEFANSFENATNSLLRYRDERIGAQSSWRWIGLPDRKNYLRCWDLFHAIMHPLQVLQTGQHLADDVRSKSVELAALIVDRCDATEKYVDSYHLDLTWTSPPSGDDARSKFERIRVKKRSIAELSDHGHEDFIQHWTDPIPPTTTTGTTISSSSSTIATTSTTPTIDIPAPTESSVPSHSSSPLVSLVFLPCLAGIFFILFVAQYGRRRRRQGPLLAISGISNSDSDSGSRYTRRNRRGVSSGQRSGGHRSWYHNSSQPNYSGYSYSYTYSKSAPSHYYSSPPPGSLAAAFATKELRDEHEAKQKADDIKFAKWAAGLSAKDDGAAAAAAAATAVTAGCSTEGTSGGYEPGNPTVPPKAKTNPKNNKGKGDSDADADSIGSDETLCWRAEPVVPLDDEIRDRDRGRSR